MRKLVRQWYEAMLAGEIEFQQSLTMEQRVMLSQFQASNRLDCI